MKCTARAACVVLATLATAGMARVSRADADDPAIHAGPTLPARPAGQGVAVVALGSHAHDEAFALARAVYASRLRPTTLDEVRARVLAGGAPPANASRELRELAEVRAGVIGENAAGRRLLTGIAQQIGVEALLVVNVEPSSRPPPADGGTGTMGDPEASPNEGVTGNAAGSPAVVARLFLTETGDFDAARYSPDSAASLPPPAPSSPAAWKSTVTSLEGRFPARPGSPRDVRGPVAATRPAPPVLPERGKSAPFYASAWFWGAVGGAALLGTGFYFATRDTGSETIHLQMRVPK